MRLDSVLLRLLVDFGLVKRWTQPAGEGGRAFFAVTPLYSRFLSFDPGPPAEPFG